ncbi:MAG: ribonuclease P protein component [marine benthic group bacterium]|nr:ribonuclease P protein component [Gemmatimonadota bacterium]
MSGTFAFPRASRLRRSSEIRSVFRSGRRHRCGPIDLFLGPGPGDAPRAAIVVPRHGHTAVERNRLKRRLREIVRLHWLPTGAKGDLIVRARPSAYGSDYGDLLEAMTGCLQRLKC